jgi:hypothetical protein
VGCYLRGEPSQIAEYLAFAQSDDYLASLAIRIDEAMEKKFGAIPQSDTDGLGRLATLDAARNYENAQIAAGASTASTTPYNLALSRIALEMTQLDSVPDTFNGYTDFSETGTDCGSPPSLPCGYSARCRADTDCSSGKCTLATASLLASPGAELMPVPPAETDTLEPLLIPEPLPHDEDPLYLAEVATITEAITLPEGPWPQWLVDGFSALTVEDFLSPRWRKYVPAGFQTEELYLSLMEAVDAVNHYFSSLRARNEAAVAREVPEGSLAVAEELLGTSYTTLLNLPEIPRRQGTRPEDGTCAMPDPIYR